MLRERQRTCAVGRSNAGDFHAHVPGVCNRSSPSSAGISGAARITGLTSYRRYSEFDSSMTRNRVWKPSLAILCLCLFLGGCSARPDRADLAIEFTRIPPGALNRTDRLDVIQGRVIGARTGQQVVLYSRQGVWWIQPLLNPPFTKIQPDSTWINTVRLGSEYAALLVEPGFRPEPMMEMLPTLGDGVAAIASAQGTPSDSTISPILRFSGYEWRIRNAPSSRGNTRNIYDPSNAWTDEEGALHLRVAKQSDQWTCAEVTLTRSLGYGTYSFVVRDTSRLEPAIVLDMFTWDYAGGDQNNREMDIEVTRWGDPASKNAQSVVQPFYVPANVVRFSVPAGVLTHSLRWEPGKLICKTVRGTAPDAPTGVVNEHVFTTGIPTPGAESVRISLYVFGKTDDVVHRDSEVVVERFEYLP